MGKDTALAGYLARLAAAEDYRRPYEERWQRWYRRWRNWAAPIVDKETGRPDNDRSNISVPYTFNQVETILPRLAEALFAARPYVTVRGRGPADAAAAQQHEALLDWQMNGVMHLPGLFGRGLKEVCLYGTAIAYTGWRWEQRPVVRRAGAGAVRRLEVVGDDPEVRFLDLDAFFIDPAATDIAGARYCGHREYLTRAELMDRVAAGLYRLNWRRLEAGRAEALAGADELYEVLHYWEDDRHAVIVNRSELVLDGPNPFWHGEKPYTRGLYCLVPGEFYGIGIPEMLDELQDELNTERNMRLDYRAFLLRRMFRVRRGATINKKQLRWRQGGIIEVDDPEDVTEMGVGDHSGSSFTAETGIKADMQETTGGHDVVMGIAEAQETATAIRTKDLNAGVRFRLVSAALRRDLLAGVARQMLELNRQFVTGEKLLPLPGGEYRAVRAAELDGDFLVTATEPAAVATPSAGELLELYRAVSGDPALGAGRVDLLRAVLMVYGLAETVILNPKLEGGVTDGGSGPAAGALGTAADAGVAAGGGGD